MDLVLCRLCNAKMKAAHPKALIQPSQQLRRGRVMRLIGQPFLAFDLQLWSLCGLKISEFYWTRTDKYVVSGIFYGPLSSLMTWS